MIKFLKVTKTAWIAFFIALIASFMIASVSHAQTASPSAQTPDTASKYGVTFPVAALGNCTDLNSCKTFCDDPINKNTCIAFAKSKGFYQEDALTTQKEAILTKAKAALGCDSATSCLNFCQIPSNYDKCSSFAQNNNLQGGVVQKPDSSQVLEKAKQILGCNSVDACKTLCSNSANQQKCADFAKQTGLRGGEQKVGPGGCTSEETCRTFCSDPNNYQVCSGFARSSGGNFSGPGGCNSPESCKVYCQQNPSACPNFTASGSQSGFNPAETCNRTPNCSWTGSTCFCGNSGNNPTSSADPAGMCGRYGCAWTGNSCQCTNISNSYNTSVYPGNNMSYSQQEASCKAGGGTCSSGSTSTFCNCQGYHSPQNSPNPSSGTYPAASSYNNPSYYCPNTCSNGYAPDPGKNCACAPVPTGAPQSCQPPSGGCGSNSYYDYSRCGCYQNNQTTPANGSCHPPSGGCGSNSYYDYSRCGCYQNGSTPTTTPPTSGSCPAGQYWNGSGCLNSNTAPQNSTAPTSTSQPAPAQTSAPQPPTTSSSTSTPPPSTPQPSSAVKGISTEINIWTWLINLFSK